MNPKYILKKALFTGILGASVILSSFIHSRLTPVAAAITIHNHVTNDSYSYSNAVVSYVVNYTKVSTPYPGIITSEGSALGPCKDLFCDAIGVSCDYREGNNSFTLSYGVTSIRMTLGNLEAFVNGKSTMMAIAPMLLSFDQSEEKVLYVPSRFVAETFGFTYNWNAQTNTSTIVRPDAVFDGNKALSYVPASPKLFLNEKEIHLFNYPGYVLDDVVFIPARLLQEQGMFDYEYRESSRLVLLQFNDLLFRFVIDSPVAYVGDTSYVLESVPRLITPRNTEKAEVYLPADFLFSFTGLSYTYDEGTSEYRLKGVLPTSESDEVPSAKEQRIPNPQEIKSTLFAYETYPQVIEYFTQQGKKVPAKIGGYSLEHTDAVYLKGIFSQNLKITDAFDVIEIEVSNSFNPYGRRTYYNGDADYLNYFNIAGNDELYLTIIKNRDIRYYVYDTEDGCVIHFCDSKSKANDRLSFVSSVASVKPAKTEIQGNTEELMPNAVFDRNEFVMRLPDGMAKAQIRDTDDYLNQRFMIKLPGDCTAFLREQLIYNPISTLKSFSISYKVDEKVTVLTFQTTGIQAYKYDVKDGFLTIRVDNPSNLYDKIVVLDAGHGGIDPGTVRGSLYEKDVNFAVINKYVLDYFSASDIKVYFTRTTDVRIALEERAAFAGKVGADLFISFHVNSSTSSASSGTSVYYSTKNNPISSNGLKSSVLADTLLQKMTSAWGTRNAGLLTADFVVIGQNTVPAALIECGFITNDKDLAKISDSSYQKKAAKAIYDAVSELFDIYPTNR